MISFVNPHIAPLLPLHVQRGCVQARVDATMVVCLEVCCLACISFRDVLPDAEGVELAVGLRLLRLALAAYPSSAFLAKVFRTAPVPADSSVAAAEPLTAKHVDQASLIRYVCCAVLCCCCVVLLLLLCCAVAALLLAWRISTNLCLVWCAFFFSSSSSFSSFSSRCRHLGRTAGVPDAVVLKLALKQTIEQLHSALVRNCTWCGCLSVVCVCV